MAKCEICGKAVQFGLAVSHSNRKTNRTWKPNIRRVKAVVNGTPKTLTSAPAAALRQGPESRPEFRFTDISDFPGRHHKACGFRGFFCCFQTAERITDEKTAYRRGRAALREYVSGI